jgi:hypothetical protein
MSVLVYVENSGGKFKKSTFEVLRYGFAIAQKMGTNTHDIYEAVNTISARNHK